MKKAARFLVVFLLVMSFCSTALAAYCTNCGGSVNTSFVYCPSCGIELDQSAYSNSSSGSSAGFSAAATAAPTSAPTAAPSSLEVVSVTDLGNGNTQIAWSDSSSNGPYSLYYMACMTHDFDTDYDTTTGLWPLSKDLTGKSAVVSGLVPGMDCWIIVFDADDNYCIYDYHPAPAQHFPEFTTDVSIQLKTNTNGAYHEYSSFSSADIARNLGSTSYGAYIRLDYSRLAKARQYQCMVTITNPRGETIVDTLTEMELSSGHTYTYWSFFNLDWYFNIITKYYGSVEPGNYTWTMYYDGMYVNSRQFRIDN